MRLLNVNYLDSIQNGLFYTYCINVYRIIHHYDRIPGSFFGWGGGGGGGRNGQKSGSKFCYVCDSFLSDKASTEVD